jgi:hypothetical protein
MMRRRIFYPFLDLVFPFFISQVLRFAAGWSFRGNA